MAFRFRHRGRTLCCAARRALRWWHRRQRTERGVRREPVHPGCVQDDLGRYGPYPWLAREMLGVLPQEEGVQHDSSTNEFPDALPHQVFREVVGGRYAPSAQVEAVERWAGIWGVPLRTDPTGARTLVIFNSSDAPLLYLVSLGAFCRLPGGRIVLGDRFIHRPTGEVRTVAEAARRCIAFVARVLSTARDSGLDLYAVPNTNPRQTSPSGVMRDGFDAYYRPGGGQDEALDYSLVAYVENQALLYEGLTLAALELFPDDPDAPEWLAAAASVRASTLKQFWIEDWQMFCPAVDRRGPVALHSTAAAELLNGPFLDDIPDAPDYVRTIVESHSLMPLTKVTTTAAKASVTGGFIHFAANWGSIASWPGSTAAARPSNWLTCIARPTSPAMTPILPFIPRLTTPWSSQQRSWVRSTRAGALPPLWPKSGRTSWELRNR